MAIDPFVLRDIRDYLKANLRLEFTHCPEYHGGERGPLYLALMLGDARLSTLSDQDLERLKESG